MKTYPVPYAPAGSPFAHAVPMVISDYHPLGTAGYAPVVKAMLAWDKQGLHVRMTAYESAVRATRTADNSDVWRDSCMEFFFNLAPDKTKNYVNIEINALGAMLLGWGDNKTCRFQDFDKSAYQLQPSLRLSDPVPCWQLDYVIPFVDMERFFGSIKPGAGMTFLGNFYKCGDETGAPHFGSLTPTDPATSCAFHDDALFSQFVLQAPKPVVALDTGAQE